MPDNITLTINQLIELAKRQLGRREAALKATLTEIELLEAAQAAPEAIHQARVKRDRQHNSIKASVGVIDALTRSKKGTK